MAFVLASGGLALWGQASAVVLGIYLFLSIITGLALVVGLLLGFAWLRDKIELLRQLHSQITRVNQALVAVKEGESLPAEMAANRIISAVSQAPKIAENIETRTISVEHSVERGSERVANVVIEFHARTEMVKGMARAFFLPGLNKTRRTASVLQVVELQPELLPEPKPLPRPELLPEPIVEAARSYREEPPMEQEIVIRRR
ncbi:MAG TPA: hypothetical protein VGD98_01745 [Ktedonobacteraceae bacterium]